MRDDEGVWSKLVGSFLGGTLLEVGQLLWRTTVQFGGVFLVDLTMAKGADIGGEGERETCT